MTNDDLLRQLGDIAQLALRDYPYADDSSLDGDLLVTLGQIAGMAHKAIEEYQRGGQRGGPRGGKDAAQGGNGQPSPPGDGRYHPLS